VAELVRDRSDRPSRRRFNVTAPATGLAATKADGGRRREQPRHNQRRDPLAALIGDSRAQILDALDQPRPTSEVAAAVGISVGAMSEHLNALAGVGVLRRCRRGRWVDYELSDAGRVLVTLFDRQGAGDNRRRR
jgi:DNA-binding transcriptional ArsR family regulator